VVFYVPRVAAIVDLNKDGKPDLLFINQTSQIDSTLSTYAAHMQVALGHGDGTFATPVDIAGATKMAAPLGASFVPIAVADMNADGNPDIVAVGASSTYNMQAAVVLGNGDGTFRTPMLKTYAAQFLNSIGLAVADFNADGKADVAITNPYDPNASGISYGNGDGTLQTTGDAASSLPSARFVLNVGGATTALDLNADGKPDLIAGTVELLSQPAASGGGGTADFAVSANAASGTVAAGASASVTVSLTPANGFSQGVTMSCSGLPAGAACSFSPKNVAMSGGVQTSTLTITTTARPVVNAGVPANPLYPAGTLLTALALPFCIRRRRARTLRGRGFMVGAALLAMATLGGCGGGSGSSNDSGTPAGTSTITIKATAGSTVHTITYTLTVT
jgi:hypothetical protein